MHNKTGRVNIKKTPKSVSSEPVAPAGPLRQRGLKRRTPLDKLGVVFQKAMADTLELRHAEFDGGGTKADAPVITKESLERRVARRLNVLDRFLTDERLIALLQQSSLKEVGIYEGIMLDKSLVLKGQPTVIIGSEDRQAMDSVLPRILAELRRRNLTTTVSERKIEFQPVRGYATESDAAS